MFRVEMSKFVFLLLSIALVGLDVLNADLYEERFGKIYQEKLWGVNEENEGFSGGGSLLDNARPYYEYLIQFIKEHNIKRIVDLGCGDWTLSKWVDWEGIEYIGYD